MPVTLTVAEDVPTGQPATVAASTATALEISISSPHNAAPGLKVTWGYVDGADALLNQSVRKRTFDVAETATAMLETVADLGLDDTATVYDIIKAAVYETLATVDPATGDPSVEGVVT